MEQVGFLKKKNILHYKRTQVNASKLRTMSPATAEELARFGLVPDDPLEVYWVGLGDGSGLFAFDSRSWRYAYCGTSDNGMPWIDSENALAHEQYEPAVFQNKKPTLCLKRDGPQARLPRSSRPVDFFHADQAEPLIEQCRVIIAESERDRPANLEKCMAKAWADHKHLQSKGAEVPTGLAATLTVGLHCKRLYK